jgi:hypothetical protein
VAVGFDVEVEREAKTMVFRSGVVRLGEEAENLIEKADCRDDPSLLTVLLGASTASSHSAIAERIAKKVIDLKPEHHLSPVY